MTLREPRWRRYARAAVNGSGQVADAEPSALSQLPARAKTAALFKLELRAKLAALSQEARAPAASGVHQRPDLRLTPTVVAVWAGAAISIGSSWPVAVGGAGTFFGVGILLGGYLWRRRHEGAETVRTGVAVAVLVAAVCLGTVLVAVGLRHYDREHSPLTQAVVSGQTLGLVMELSSTPRPLARGRGPQQVFFDAVVLQATAHGQLLTGRLEVQVIAGDPWAKLREGAIVSAVGASSRSGTPGKVVAVLRPATAPLQVQMPAGSPVRQMRAAWVNASQGAWASVAPDTAALLPGMVMGDRSAVTPALSESMKTVGLTHLTAVSGANCTLVLASLMLGLRTLHLPRAPTTAAAIAGLAGFVAVVGLDPSVLRAALMGGIGCLAVLGGRPKRVGALLSVSIVVLLILDPWLAIDYAFILSVLATLGLHLVGRRCALWLGVWLPWWLAQALAIPLAAQLFCAPVIVLLAPRLTLFTVPANMAAAPVVALVTTVGTFGMVAGFWWPALAQVCAAISGTGAWWVASVAQGMSALPGASLPWPAGARGAILMAVVNAAVLLALLGLLERHRFVLIANRVRSRLPPGLRFLFGFPCLTVVSAVCAGLWMLAVTGP
ncbi:MULTISPECIES: ComEC/Rec2 family competence protein [Arthrobacter]|uniref:ComEC/Rec2 family competence protein n=1 Tax=Arthrobacter TaxID=1663 RepID=UPI000AC63B6A|nr:MULTISPECIES: ComEC/Rec2 family competence protein [Arthrobacter]